MSPSENADWFDVLMIMIVNTDQYKLHCHELTFIVTVQQKDLYFPKVFSANFSLHASLSMTFTELLVGIYVSLCFLLQSQVT